MIRRPIANPSVILAVASGAQFMFILDLAIVVLALPSIQSDFGVEESDAKWVVVTYGLAVGGFLLLGGRAADRYGRRNALAVGLLAFTAASLSAGLASSLAPLVVSRAVQGVGAALAAPAALSTVTSTFAEGPARNRALGIFGAVGASAASVGLVAGGLLTSGPGWPWIFLINVPVGAGLVALAIRYVPNSSSARPGAADVAGAVTVTAGLMAIVYGASEGPAQGWTSARALPFLVGGVALLVAFGAIERRAPAPILPRSVFRQRNLTVANVLAALVFASFLGYNLQLSVFLQQVLGYSAIRTGLAWLATSLAAVLVGTAVAARVVDRIGAGLALAAGQTSAATGLLLLSRVPSNASYVGDLLPSLVLIGIGIGLSGMAVQVAAFIGIAPSFAGTAGGLVESFREIGGAVGTAVIATVAATRARGAQRDGGAELFAITQGIRASAVAAAILSVTAAVIAATALGRAGQRSVERSPVDTVDGDPRCEVTLAEVAE